jgi:hypothetical protein
MGVPPLPAEVLKTVLKQLADVADGDVHIVLIGGQAVSIWASVLGHEDLGRETALASRDIDFVGTKELVKQCAARLPQGEAKYPWAFDMTPNSGVVLFMDDDGVTRQIDFLASVAGLNDRDVAQSAQRVEIDEGDGSGAVIPVWVMHPERCMESRAHNILMFPDKRTPLGLDQLRSSIVSAQAFSKLLLDSDQLDDPRIAAREVLKLNERIAKFALGAGMRIYLEYDIDVFEAVLLDDRLPAMFATERYPRMQETLLAKRARLVRAKAMMEKASPGPK